MIRGIWAGLVIGLPAILIIGVIRTLRRIH